MQEVLTTSINKSVESRQGHVRIEKGFLAITIHFVQSPDAVISENSNLESATSNFETNAINTYLNCTGFYLLHLAARTCGLRKFFFVAGKICEKAWFRL